MPPEGFDFQLQSSVIRRLRLPIIERLFFMLRYWARCYEYPLPPSFILSYLKYNHGNSNNNISDSVSNYIINFPDFDLRTFWHHSKF